MPEGRAAVGCVVAVAIGGVYTRACLILRSSCLTVGFVKTYDIEGLFCIADESNLRSGSASVKSDTASLKNTHITLDA